MASDVSPRQTGPWADPTLHYQALPSDAERTNRSNGRPSAVANGYVRGSRSATSTDLPFAASYTWPVLAVQLAVVPAQNLF
jgi:hypothetical protein